MHYHTMMAFSALADPTRVRIVEMLAEHGQLPVARIGMQFTISAPAISQHLKVLKEANLVQVQVQAQQRIYSLNPAGMWEIGGWVAKVRQMWEHQLDSLDAFLKQDGEDTPDPAAEAAAEALQPPQPQTRKRKKR